VTFILNRQSLFAFFIIKSRIALICHCQCNKNVINSIFRKSDRLLLKCKRTCNDESSALLTITFCCYSTRLVQYSAKQFWSTLFIKHTSTNTHPQVSLGSWNHVSVCALRSFGFTSDRWLLLCFLPGHRIIAKVRPQIPDCRSLSVSIGRLTHRSRSLSHSISSYVSSVKPVLFFGFSTLVFVHCSVLPTDKSHASNCDFNVDEPQVFFPISQWQSIRSVASEQFKMELRVLIPNELSLQTLIEPEGSSSTGSDSDSQPTLFVATNRQIEIGTQFKPFQGTVRCEQVRLV
jgi:hypothetical protein